MNGPVIDGTASALELIEVSKVHPGPVAALRSVSVTIGTGERRISASELLRLMGQRSIGPSGVADQSKFAMISAASPPSVRNG